VTFAKVFEVQGEQVLVVIGNAGGKIELSFTTRIAPYRFAGIGTEQRDWAHAEESLAKVDQKMAESAFKAIKAEYAEFMNSSLRQNNN